MAKETCSNCGTRLAAGGPFCPTCERPTRYANDAERLDWDLKQWRAHVDRSMADGRDESRDATPVVRTVLAVAEPAPVFTPPVSVPEPDPVLVQPKRSRIPRLRVERPRFTRAKITPAEPDRVIDLDNDQPFAYRACPTCEAKDWIVRLNRNDDETWNYWCVRCSRSFKTDNKLRYAIKPFVSAGAVIGGLLAATALILH
jgi:uncharacterized Zn finger protein (UPF0148 family)